MLANPFRTRPTSICGFKGHLDMTRTLLLKDLEQRMHWVVFFLPLLLLLPLGSSTLDVHMILPT